MFQFTNEEKESTAHKAIKQKRPKLGSKLGSKERGTAKASTGLEKEVTEELKMFSHTVKTQRNDTPIAP